MSISLFPDNNNAALPTYTSAVLPCQDFWYTVHQLDNMRTTVLKQQKKRTYQISACASDSTFSQNKPKFQQARPISPSLFLVVPQIPYLTIMDTNLSKAQNASNSTNK